MLAMRAAFLALLLLALACAAEVDNETGCEMYADHLICPQGTDVQTTMRYTSDADCFSMLNEFNTMENVGCTSEATLTSALEYQDCRMYVPFNGSDIQLSEIQYDYSCSTEKLAAGTAIQVIGFEDQYSGCATTAEDTGTRESLCAVSGKEYSVNATIAVIDGEYSIVLYSQEAGANPLLDQLGTPLLLLGVAVLLVYALYIWSERKK